MSRATAWPVGRDNFNNRYNVNGYNYNNRASRGIVPCSGALSYENIQTSIRKAVFMG